MPADPMKLRYVGAGGGEVGGWGGGGGEWHKKFFGNFYLSYNLFSWILQIGKDGEMDIMYCLLRGANWN